MNELSAKTCQPCEGGVSTLNSDEIATLLGNLQDWICIENHHLHKEFSFSNFVTALEFVNRVGEVAEQEGHHPNIFLTWGQVKIDIWTHAIDGLSENDFILGAKIDALS